MRRLGINFKDNTKITQLKIKELYMKLGSGWEVLVGDNKTIGKCDVLLSDSGVVLHYGQAIFKLLYTTSKTELLTINKRDTVLIVSDLIDTVKFCKSLEGVADGI